MSGIVKTAHSPQLLSEEWIAKLNVISQREVLDELALRRVEMQIESTLAKTNDSLVKAISHQCLGTVAAIRRNHKKIILEYKSAFSFVVDRRLQMNYAVDLRRGGCFRELRAISNQLFNSYPDDLNILRELMNSFEALGDYVAIDAIRTRLIAMNKFDNVASSFNWKFIENFAEKAHNFGVSSEQISKVFDTALKAVEDQGFSPLGTGFCLDTEDWSASLRFVVLATSEQRVQLGSAIAKAIVNEHENDLSELISFGVMAPRKRLHAIES